MFALLVPAGFAVVLKVGAHIDAHKKHRQACEKAKANSSFRGAAAGALPDADVELWRAKAELATERIQGLESIITVRGAASLAPQWRPLGAASRRLAPAAHIISRISRDARQQPAMAAHARRRGAARSGGDARAAQTGSPGLCLRRVLCGAAQEMTRKLDEEERLREEAEEVAGEKLLEIDALKCVRCARLVGARTRSLLRHPRLTRGAHSQEREGAC